MNKHSQKWWHFEQSFGEWVEMKQECKAIPGMKDHAVLEKYKHPRRLEEKEPQWLWWRLKMKSQPWRQIVKGLEQHIRKLGVRDVSHEEPSKISNQGTGGIQFGFWIKTSSFSVDDELEQGDR